MPQSKPRSRAVPLLLAIAAAVGLVIGAFGPRWLTDPDHVSSGFGLTSYTSCALGADKCQDGSIGELLDKIEAEIAQIEKRNQELPPSEQMAVPKKPWRGFAVVGMLAFVMSLVAAGGLLVGAGLAIGGKRPELPIMPTTLAVLGLFLAIINGCIFVATKPTGIESMEVGWTFLTFGGAAVLGLAAVFPLNRLIRPIDHELGEASATMSWGESRDEQ